MVDLLLLLLLAMIEISTLMRLLLYILDLMIEELLNVILVFLQCYILRINVLSKNQFNS